MVRSGVALALAVAGIAITAVPASGGSVGSQGGVNYQRVKRVVAGDPSLQPSTVRVKPVCDQGWRVLNGGLWTEDAEGVALSSSSPTDSRSWLSRVVVTSSVDWQVEGFSTCVKADGTAEQVVRRSATKADLPDDWGTVSQRVMCPSGHVVGGGMSAVGDPQNFRLTSSYPIDSSADEDSTRDDGWKVTLFYGGQDGNDEVAAHAVCLSGQQPSYRKAAASIEGTGAAATRTAACPPQRPVVGGGVQVTGDPWNLSVRGSAPYDDADALATPDDGWRASVASNATTTQQMSTFAICR